MNGTELRSLCSFSNFDLNSVLTPQQNLENLLILKFVFIHCKPEKVSQNDQIEFELHLQVFS